MNVPDNYKVMFQQGGASLQFTAIPLNMLGEKNDANYITTGSWSSAAIKEAKKYCKPTEVWPESQGKYSTVPEPSTWKLSEDAAFFHYCDNETIGGVEFNDFPYEKFEGKNIVCDMSSNFCSRPVDWSKYAMVYAGAQKNVGPAGCTILVIRDDLFESKSKENPCPMLCDWKQFKDAPDQFHNTPCCWSIYVSGLNLAYMKKKGLKAIEEEAVKKSEMLYNMIDNSDGYYSNPVEKKYRSRINIPFRVKCDEALEAKFIKEVTAAGMIELKGHRSVGGCRASVYNGMPVEGVETLVAFMKKFQADNA